MIFFDNLDDKFNLWLVYFENLTELGWSEVCVLVKQSRYDNRTYLFIYLLLFFRQWLYSQPDLAWLSLAGSGFGNSLTVF